MEEPTNEMSELSANLAELSDSETELQALTSDFVDEILAKAVNFVHETHCPSCNAYITSNLISKNQCPCCDKFIDEFVGYAIKNVKEKLEAEDGRNYIFNEYKQPENITWFNIEQYSTNFALGKIEQYIQTWEFHPSWQYCIDYMSTEESEFDYHHKFRVRWSIATRCKPIPRATACTYFTFRVSKIKPKNYPVEVSFVIETNQLVHWPGKTRFREKWLKDVIESKIKYCRLYF